MSDSELCLQEIGKRIMDRRKKLGLTQEALAEKGEVTTQFVSYAESGKRAMRPENLLKISSALEVSADYLLTGEIIDKDLLILSDKLRLSLIHIYFYSKFQLVLLSFQYHESVPNGLLKQFLHP